MKGVVFTEFLEMVENSYSPDLVDDIIESAELKSQGAFTAVGTYDHNEIIQLVGALSKATGESTSKLLRKFGNHLFKRFTFLYPDFFNGINSAFEFLIHVDDTVHGEVRKLYPDAELPSFTCESIRDKQLIMNYLSSRPFGDLADGLIHGCIEYFGEPISVQRKNIELSSNNTHVKFVLKHDERSLWKNSKD